MGKKKHVKLATIYDEKLKEYQCPCCTLYFEAGLLRGQKKIATEDIMEYQKVFGHVTSEIWV